MPFIGHVILVIEPQQGRFAIDLQKAIKREGGESIVVSEPAAALLQCKAFEFTAALVNDRHRGIISKLSIPSTLYRSGDSYRTAIKRLEELIGTTRLQ